MRATNWVKAVDNNDVIVQVDSAVFQEYFHLSDVASVVDVVQSLVVDVLRRTVVNDLQRHLMCKTKLAVKPRL